MRRLYRQVFPHRPPDYATLWNTACHKWVVGMVQLDKGQLHVTGWAITPLELRPHVDFRINGQPVDQVVYPVPRPDVAAHLRFVAEAHDSGFDITTRLPDGTTELGDLTISCVDKRTGELLGWDYQPYHVPSSTRFGPMPAPNQITRVIGAPSDFYFRIGGWTVFQTLCDVVQETTGQAITAFPRVLDWGCGCARVSRYFLPLPGVQVTGADVDPDNIGWCQTNFPSGTWEILPLRPPSQLEPASFDLAFGISVFTHLKEAEQFAWLQELQRVIRPGGLALMTFHGDASVLWSGLSAERYTALKRRGICDQANPLYDADLGEDDYYRDVFHTTEYVRREWGKYFELVTIKPCSVAHQDLVVLRRK